jgi:hypothetical protein
MSSVSSKQRMFFSHAKGIRSKKYWRGHFSKTEAWSAERENDGEKSILLTRRLEQNKNEEKAKTDLFQNADHKFGLLAFYFF